MSKEHVVKKVNNSDPNHHPFRTGVSSLYVCAFGASRRFPSTMRSNVTDIHEVNKQRIKSKPHFVTLTFQACFYMSDAKKSHKYNYYNVLLMNGEETLR